MLFVVSGNMTTDFKASSSDPAVIFPVAARDVSCPEAGFQAATTKNRQNQECSCQKKSCWERGKSRDYCYITPVNSNPNFIWSFSVRLKTSFSMVCSRRESFLGLM